MKYNLWLAAGIFLSEAGIMLAGFSIILINNKKELLIKIALGSILLIIGCVIISSPDTIIGSILMAVGFVFAAKSIEMFRNNIWPLFIKFNK